MKHAACPSALLAVLLLCPPASAGQSPQGKDKRDDILMGSVVKSESWSMDRNTDTEHFTGNVRFSNPGYSLRADEAVYYRGRREWSVKGQVAVRRLLEDGSTVDLACDRGRYAEEGEKAELFRGAESVRSVYTAKDGRALKARSDRLLASGAENLMTFEKDFSLTSENIVIVSSRAVYDDTAASFLITGDRPLAAGVNEDYNFAMSADRLLFFRDSRDMKASGGVAGWVKDKEASDAAAR
ncbi:MAG TPA: LptA/OstA family protein [Elusimicrobiales bacterium]|nr:LptA/OstA family protein [Elusimicrobiales bacterium]